MTERYNRAGESAKSSETLAIAAPSRIPRKRLARKLSLGKWLPSYLWQRVTRSRRRGQVHLIFALADHFEPAIIPEDGRARATRSEQIHRVERWCADYPAAVDGYRDHEGRALVHTYFYPAEQYDRDQLDLL